MNIYEARKLQKKMYKDSQVDYKHIKTYVSPKTGQLIYSVVHKVAEVEELPVVMTSEFVGRLAKYMQKDVQIVIDVLTEERKRNAVLRISSPSGVYIGERIEVD